MMLAAHGAQRKSGSLVLREQATPGEKTRGAPGSSCHGP